MTQIAIVGVDPSSRKLAITTTFGSADKPEMVTIDLPSDHSEGCGLAFRRFFEYLSGVKERTGHTPFVFQEEAVSSRNVRSTIVQARVGGAVEAACYESLVSITLVNNKTWKSRMMYNGNAGKPEIAEWIHDNWPQAFELAGGDQDLLDASVINRFGNMELLVPKRKVIVRRLRAKVAA